MSARIMSAEAEREWLGKGLLDGLPLTVLMAARNAVANAHPGQEIDPLNPMGLPLPMIETPRLLADEGFQDRRALYARHFHALVDGYTPPREDVEFIELGRALGVPEEVLTMAADLLLIERMTPRVFEEVLLEEERGRKPLTNH